jgi:anti-anti-sigma factor
MSAVGEHEGFAVHDIRGIPLLGMTVVVSDPYHPDLVRVALSGELSMRSAARLESLVDGLTGAGVTVRLNLCDLSSCTSDGLEVLQRTRDRLERLGGSLELVGAHGVVRGVLDMAGFAATALPA